MFTHKAAMRNLAIMTVVVSLIIATQNGQALATIITFGWDWEIVVEPNIGTPTAPVFGDPIPIPLWGIVQMQFGDLRCLQLYN